MNDGNEELMLAINQTILVTSRSWQSLTSMSVGKQVNSVQRRIKRLITTSDESDA